MAHPYHHALSSAKKFASHWENHYPIHAFLDSSKAHLADARHRSLLHCPAGAQLASHLPNPKLPQEIKKAIAERHIHEDLGCIPNLREWISPKPPFKAPWERLLTLTSHQLQRLLYEQATSTANLQDRKLVLPILLTPENTEELSLHPARFFYFSSPGPFICEAVLGPITPNGNPTRTVAEALIQNLFGKIPSLQDFLSKTRIKAWMYKKAAKLSQTL